MHIDESALSLTLTKALIFFCLLWFYFKIEVLQPVINYLEYWVFVDFYLFTGKIRCKHNRDSCHSKKSKTLHDFTHKWSHSGSQQLGKTMKRTVLYFNQYLHILRHGLLKCWGDITMNFLAVLCMIQDIKFSRIYNIVGLPVCSEGSETQYF